MQPKVKTYWSLVFFITVLELGITVNAQSMKELDKPSKINISSQYTGMETGVPVISPPKPCGTNKYEITVIVGDITHPEGRVVADLHNDIEDGGIIWNKTMLRVRVPTQKGKTKFCIPVAKPGTYALAVYYDKNNNGKFDKGIMHIPKEMFGMSNNPDFGLKMPAFKEAEFQVSNTGVQLEITLRSAHDILNKHQNEVYQKK